MLWSQLVKIFFCMDWVVNRYKYLAKISNIVTVLIQTKGKHRLKFCESLLLQPRKTLNSYQEHEFHRYVCIKSRVLRGGYPIIFASNVFHNFHLIQKCIQNQQLLLILYTFLNQMRVVKNIRRKDDWK